MAGAPRRRALDARRPGVRARGDRELPRRARDAGSEPGEIVLQAMVAWGPDDDAALEGARVWKGAQPPEYYVDDWHDPAAM